MGVLGLMKIFDIVDGKVSVEELMTEWRNIQKGVYTNAPMSVKQAATVTLGQVKNDAETHLEKEAG